MNVRGDGRGFKKYQNDIFNCSQYCGAGAATFCWSRSPSFYAWLRLQVCKFI
jgi:hypothetical protein